MTQIAIKSLPSHYRCRQKIHISHLVKPNDKIYSFIFIFTVHLMAVQSLTLVQQEVGCS